MTYNELFQIPATFANMATVLATAPTPFSTPVRHVPKMCLKEGKDNEDEDVDMLGSDNKWPTTTTPPSTPNVSSGIPTTGGHRVTFSKIEIIELPYCLGDNPCCVGPPIAPSWIAQKRTTLDLEFFERYRPERRSKNALLLSRQARKSLLIGSGYSPKEILMATSDASRIRKERGDTIHQLRLKCQGMVIKANQLSPSSKSPPPSPTPSPSLSPHFHRRPHFRAVAGGSEKIDFPNLHLRSRMAMSPPPENNGAVIGASKKKKHPGLHSPKHHSKGNNHLPMVQPQRHPLSPTNNLLPTPPRRPI